MDSTPSQSDIAAWERAQSLMKAIGSVSSSFSTTVRALIMAAGEDQGARRERLTPTATVMIRQLLKSPSVLSHIWFAAKTFYSDEIEKRKKVKPEEILDLFSLYEVAALLTILYMHRRLNARVGTEELAPLSKSLQLYCDVAIPLGQVIPSLGQVRALLVAAARPLGWGGLTLLDAAAMKKYRIGLKVKKAFADISEELALFGTTHLHVYSTFLTTFGFPTAITNTLFQGLSNAEESLDDSSRRYRVAQLWLDSLIIENTAPTTTLGDEYLISENREESFLKHVERVLNDGSPFSWLQKSRHDISTSLTPELDADYAQLESAAQKPRNPFQRAEADEEDET